MIAGVLGKADVVLNGHEHAYARIEIRRAKVGSHPISHDLIRFTVQRVNGVVRLQALVGEYLPPATPWLDQSLSACPNLDQGLAKLTRIVSYLE